MKGGGGCISKAPKLFVLSTPRGPVISSYLKNKQKKRSFCKSGFLIAEEQKTYRCFMMFKENKLPKKAVLSCLLWGRMGRMLPGAGDHSGTEQC